MVKVNVEVIDAKTKPVTFLGAEIKRRNGVYQLYNPCDKEARFIIKDSLMILVSKEGNHCDKLSIDSFLSDKFVESNDKVVLTFE